MLLCSSLVMLMTPGLAFFYGGLVGRKNVPAIMKQTIPEIMFIAYQMMFAIITPALITGAFANRVSFNVYMLFLTGWLLFVYFPFVHVVWGGGPLEQWGVRDFAGGIVVHNIAGMAALASVLYIGRRAFEDRGPHSVPLVALGTGLLWFGWYGFNAGSEFRVDATTAVAFLNTDVAASFAAIAWLGMAWVFEKRPSFLGLLTGAVAGLATVTPAAGYVSPVTAIIIGIVSGAVCYGAVSLKNRLHWDDALDVWGVHGVGGFLGIVLLGIFEGRGAVERDAVEERLFGAPRYAFPAARAG
jgi:Amt family ammonium transporter